MKVVAHVNLMHEYISELYAYIIAISILRNLALMFLLILCIH